MSFVKQKPEESWSVWNGRKQRPCWHKGLAKLPEQYRVAVELFYLQEQSYEEIATIMEIPLGTVKTYLFRGRARLKVLLADAVNEEVRAA